MTKRGCLLATCLASQLATLGLATLGLATLGLATIGLAACGGEATKAQPDAASSSASSSAPAAAQAAAPEVKGASFVAKIEAVPAKAGQPATAIVTVVPTSGYKVNEEYPYKFKLDAAPEGVTFPMPVVTEVERTKQLATMKVPFVAAKAGTTRIAGTCSLSVCTDENCVIEKVALAVDVKVE